MAEIYATNRGDYLLADDGATFEQLPLGEGLRYAAKLFHSVRQIVKVPERVYGAGEHEICMTHLNPHQLRVAIQTLRDRAREASDDCEVDYLRLLEELLFPVQTG